MWWSRSNFSFSRRWYNKSLIKEGYSACQSDVECHQIHRVQTTTQPLHLLRDHKDPHNVALLQSATCPFSQRHSRMLSILPLLHPHWTSVVRIKLQTFRIIFSITSILSCSLHRVILPWEVDVLLQGGRGDPLTFVPHRFFKRECDPSPDLRPVHRSKKPKKKNLKPKLPYSTITPPHHKINSPRPFPRYVNHSRPPLQPCKPLKA